MKRFALPTAFLLATALAVGCEDSRMPTAVHSEGATFGKTSSGSTDTDPRARWEFYSTLTDVDATQSRLYGDGRDVNGGTTTGASVYQGDMCGVHAKIFVGNGGGDGVIDPDKNYKTGACTGGARYLNYNLGNGTVIQAGSFTNARGVYHLSTKGAFNEQDMWHSYTNIPNCESLRFEKALGSGVRATRLSENTAAGQWRVETIGDHIGRCYNYVKGKYVHRDGVDPQFTMPYHAVVTEVK